MFFVFILFPVTRKSDLIITIARGRRNIPAYCQIIRIFYKMPLMSVTQSHLGRSNFPSPNWRRTILPTHRVHLWDVESMMMSCSMVDRGERSSAYSVSRKKHVPNCITNQLFHLFETRKFFNGPKEIKP
jgi:hypothetical protein